MIVRHEEDYTWTKPCRAALVQLDPWGPSRGARPHVFPPVTILPFLGFDAGTRCEDLRPFVWRDQVLISHVAYQPGSGRPVRQRLSTLRADWSAIERWDDWALPRSLADIEKNWALVDSPAGLLCIYSLSPFVRLQRTYDRWVTYGEHPNDWSASLGHTPRCSTHLLPWRDGYLGWWHIRLDGIYCQGAYWLDKDLRLRRRSGILLDGQEIQYSRRYVNNERLDPVDLGPTGIYKPGVLYLSSWVDRGDDLWLFYGVGDAHSNVAVVKADDVDRYLR